jgi:DNA-binding LacI/PurR family transcriptional regulator
MSDEKAKRIAVIIPYNSPSTWRKLEGIMTFARLRPEWEIALVSYDSPAAVRRAVRKANPNGIICARLDEKTMAYVTSLSLPTVVAFHPDDTQAKPKGATYVISDGQLIGRAVARHARARGYRSFLCVGRFGAEWENERFTAFESEISKFGGRSERLSAPFSQDALQKALEALPPRSAVFAADDIVAVEILNLAHRKGLDVPQRFGVVGVSDFTALCENSHPPLTSLDQDFARGGYLAAQRLDTILKGGIVPKTSYYPPGKIHERDSLPQVSAHHSLATDLAMAFIARNVAQPIEVPDVVSAAGVSRRTLENLFRHELKSSVAGKIRQARIEHLAKEISRSDAPINEICLSCGWPHAAHAMRLFKKRFNSTMGEWRKAQL